MVAWRTTLLLIVICMCHEIFAQQSDVAMHVAKPKASITFRPEYDALSAGRTYDFVVTGISPALVRKVEADFGTVTYHNSPGGKTIDIKVNVIGSNTSNGTLTIKGDANAILATHPYRIVAAVRYTDYSPSIPGSGSDPVILMLNKDTLSDNGSISLARLTKANKLTLLDGKLPQGVIRRNLMCRIRIMQDSVITLHSALDYLSDKVKSGLAKARPGDRILISSMENLWIDAARETHITTYAGLTYEVKVTE